MLCHYAGLAHPLRPPSPRRRLDLHPRGAATRTSAEAPYAPPDDPSADRDDADVGEPADAWTPPPDRRETAPAWLSDSAADDVAEVPEPNPPPRRAPMPSRTPRAADTIRARRSAP
jgi:hypothetical protein